MADTFKIKKKIEIKGFIQNFNNRFCRLLDTITPRPQDPKDLVITKQVRSLFELIIDQKRLKQREVSLVTLNQESVNRYGDSSDSWVVFMIPPQKKYLKMVKMFMANVKVREISKKYAMVIYPKRNVVTQYLIKKYNMHLDLGSHIYDFNLDLVPLNVDLLSLEHGNCLREMFITKEFESINLVAQSLMKLQLIYGKCKSFYSCGKYACDAVQICQRNEKTNKVLMDKCEKGKNFYFFWNNFTKIF